MAHFAQIDGNGKVLRVIVAEQAFIDSGAAGSPSSWLQTSYNTSGGVHYGPDGLPDGGVALRGNYAGPGYTYNQALDAFIPPKKYPSWLLDSATFLWKAPIAMPTDGSKYVWDEKNIAWVKFVTLGDASYTQALADNQTVQLI